LNTLEYVLWASVFIIIYNYFLYPLIVFAWSRIYPAPSYAAADDLPTVSIIISAYNEEAAIGEKIRNCLSLDYPPECLDVLVGSDGSTDRTNEILESLSNPRVTFISFSGRRGKNFVVNDLVKESKSEILVFSDANVMFEKDALRRLVQPFSDGETGGVCGRLVMIRDNGRSRKSAEQSYWSYENFLKKCESRIRTIFGATGAIYAVRRSLFREIPTERPVVDDFIIPMFVVLQGYRVVYEEHATATERIVDDLLLEFRRRIRIGSHNLNGIRYYARLLRPGSGFTAFGLISHKLLRWFVPFIMIVLFASTYLLADRLFYLWLFRLECAFILCAALGTVLNILKIRIKFLSYCAYLLLLNLGLFLGFVKFLTGSQKAHWESTPHPSD